MKPKRFCSVKGCKEKHWGKGLCQSHYMKQPYIREKQREYIRKYISKKMKDPVFRERQKEYTRKWIQKHKNDKSFKKRMGDAQKRWLIRQRMMNKYRLSKNFYKDFFNFVKTDQVDTRNFIYLGNARVRNIITYAYLDRKTLRAVLQVINADTRQQSWKKISPKDSLEMYDRVAKPYEGWVYAFKPEKVKQLIREGKLC